MIDTPETDAAEMPIDRVDTIASRPMCVVSADLARKLERERDELAERLDFQKKLNRECIDQITSRTKERDEARDRADTMFANHADILDQARRERDEAREQRDKLAEALRELRDAEWLTMPGRANNIVEAAIDTLNHPEP